MMNSDTVLVPMRQATLTRLVDSGMKDGATFDVVVTKLIERRHEFHTTASRLPIKQGQPKSELATPERHYRYRATLRGNVIGGDALWQVLAGVLNHMADEDSGFLARLSAEQGRSRRHVARNRDAIHPGRGDLNRRFTREFRPGWYIGTNYSAADTRRILRAACTVAELTFGQDLTVDF